MTTPTLDPRTALVVVDLQKGITSLPTAPHAAEPVVERSARLAAAFRERGLPVVLVNVAGGAPGRTEAGGASSGGEPPADWAELRPELGAAADDVLVTKERWGAFHGTDLDAELRRRGVTQIAVTGIATSIGVESTARGGYAHGYHVTLVTDAMTDLDADTHANSVERIFPRLGERTTTDELLKLLG